jgi:hypothetical protein
MMPEPIVPVRITATPAAREAIRLPRVRLSGRTQPGRPFFHL